MKWDEGKPRLDTSGATCYSPKPRMLVKGRVRPQPQRAMPHTLQLEATAYTKQQLAFANSPQAALAGRSNVGKSSLINALAGRKQLAKVSATPGKTRSINYYRIDAGQTFLVDLPGYGYARCSKEERQKWAGLLEYYLTRTPGLKALILLLDGRLMPQVSDREMAAFAQNRGIPLVAVLTKADKAKQREREAARLAWETLLGPVPLILTSAEKKTGLDSLWEQIWGVLGELDAGSDAAVGEPDHGEEPA